MCISGSVIQISFPDDLIQQMMQYNIWDSMNRKTEKGMKREPHQGKIKLQIQPVLNIS